MQSEERPASRTALSVAVLRAVHQIYDGSPKILEDPIARLLIDDAILQRVDADRAWQQDPLASAIRSHVVLRSRYAEDCLHEAVQRGVQQYVLLGSGLDTFAYRQPEWAAALRIFEVDHPASQRAKIDRLRSSQIPHPPNLEYVAADFEAASLRDILVNNSSLDCEAPAFFSCLGVLVYLPQPSITPIFELIASFPRRSEIVFTFSQGGDSSGLTALAQAAAAVGEVFRTYHQPDALRADLTAMGFSQVSILSPEEARLTYYQDRSDGLPPPRRESIARAICMTFVSSNGNGPVARQLDVIRGCRSRNTSKLVEGTFG